MSRIGRKPIAIPAGVEVTVENSVVTVKGPKGTMTQAVNPDLTVAIENGEVLVTRPSDDKEHRSLHGLPEPLLQTWYTAFPKASPRSWRFRALVTV